MLAISQFWMKRIRGAPDSFIAKHFAGINTFFDKCALE
jgi:hypothetical protein